MQCLCVQKYRHQKKNKKKKNKEFRREFAQCALCTLVFKYFLTLKTVWKIQISGETFFLLCCIALLALRMCMCVLFCAYLETENMDLFTQTRAYINSHLDTLTTGTHTRCCTNTRVSANVMCKRTRAARFVSGEKFNHRLYIPIHSPKRKCLCMLSESIALRVVAMSMYECALSLCVGTRTSALVFGMCVLLCSKALVT